MNYSFVNKSNRDMGEVEQVVNDFYPYAQERLNIDQPVKIILMSDSENARKILGRTGYYDPENMEVVVYVDDRHPKDILRSISHELIHHAQNCRGEFDELSALSSNYAQEDDHMRKMEMEAYLLSNGDDAMIFRDWENQKAPDAMINEGKQKKDIEKGISDILKEKKSKTQHKPTKEPKVSDKQWYRQQVYKRLQEKWSK